MDRCLNIEDKNEIVKLDGAARKLSPLGHSKTANHRQAWRLTEPTPGFLVISVSLRTVAFP
jgi:hypothetical protein